MKGDESFEVFNYFESKKVSVFPNEAFART